MIIYPLNSTQLDMLQESDSETLVTDYSVNVCIDIPSHQCHADELGAAVQTVLDTLHYTHVHLVRQLGGEVMVSEETDIPNLVWMHEMGDDEWNSRRHQFPRPFSMLEEPGIRFHVVKTSTRTILWHEYNHLFFDGMSMVAALRAVEDALAGRPLTDQGDVTARWNTDEQQSFSTEVYRRAQATSIRKFKGTRYTDICRKTDNPWGETLCGSSLLPNERLSHFKLDDSTLATVCTAAYALALGLEAGTDDVVFMTTSHGRNDRRLHAGVFGNFMKSMSLRINVSPSQTVAELLSQTRAALFGMMRCLAYPWTHLMRDLGLPPEQQVGTEMNISGTAIYEYMQFKGAAYPSYHIEMSRSRMHLLLVVQRREEGLLFSAEGSSALYSQQQLDRMAWLTAEYTNNLCGDSQRLLKDLLTPAPPQGRGPTER